MRNVIVAALVCGVASAAFWLMRLRSPPLPVPIISNPDHQSESQSPHRRKSPGTLARKSDSLLSSGLADTVAHICDVYRDYLSFSSATQVQTLYEALSLDAARNPGAADVWAALRDRVEGDYHANGVALGDDGPPDGSPHGDGHLKGDGKEYLGGRGEEEASSGSPPRLTPSPPMAPRASEVWAQIGNVLIDGGLRMTYDQAFMSVLTGLGVDRTAALSRTCRWSEEQ